MAQDVTFRIFQNYVLCENVANEKILLDNAGLKQQRF